MITAFQKIFLIFVTKSFQHLEAKLFFIISFYVSFILCNLNGHQSKVDKIRISDFITLSCTSLAVRIPLSWMVWFTVCLAINSVPIRLSLLHDQSLNVQDQGPINSSSRLSPQSCSDDLDDPYQCFLPSVDLIKSGNKQEQQ